jgi:transposase
MTQRADYSESPVLCMSIDASDDWALAFGTSGNHRTPSTKIPRGSEQRLRAAMESARKKLGLPEGCRVVTCYEAGRDSFWIHRWLEARGFENVVVHAASLQVDQRFRRAKTDRIDARLLVRSLVRHVRGEVDVWKVVHVPTVAQEDARHPQRELERLKKERTQHLVRIKSLFVTQGVYAKKILPLLENLDGVRGWDGQPLPPNLRREIEREAQRLDIVKHEIAAVTAEREASLKEPATDLTVVVKRLAMLKGVGIDSAWLLATEFFAWRKFRNRGEVAGAAGLGGTPFASGNMFREQGISKAGNRRIRTRMIELAWKWLQYQPDSDLAQWFHRFAQSGRLKRVGIVAVARKLLVSLWHFVEHEVTPKYAVLKKAVA